MHSRNLSHTHAQNFASALRFVRAEARLFPRAGGENEPGNESLCDYPDKERVTRPVGRGGSRGFERTPLLTSKRFYIHL